jgi:hypothetical protein
MGYKLENVTLENPDGSTLEQDPEAIRFGSNIQKSDLGGGKHEIDVDPYTDSEARAAVRGNVELEELTSAGSAGTVAKTDGDGNVTMVDPETLTHSKYTDAEARNAVTGNVNVENLITQGAADTVPLSDGAGNLSMTDIDTATSDAPVDSVFGRKGAVTAQSGDYDHSQLSGVGSSDHHTKYTDTEARNAVTGNVNVEDLTTTGSSDTVPVSDGAGNLSMGQPWTSTGGGGGSGRFYNSPYYVFNDGDTEVLGTLRVASGTSVDISECGIQNDLQNIPSGLDVVIQDVTNGTEVLRKNEKLSTGSPLATLSGAADFEFRIENTTGSTQAASAFVGAEGSSSGGSSTDLVDTKNTNRAGNLTTVQSDTPIINFLKGIAASWDSTNGKADVGIADIIDIDALQGVADRLIDVRDQNGNSRAGVLNALNTVFAFGEVDAGALSLNWSYNADNVSQPSTGEISIGFTDNHGNGQIAPFILPVLPTESANGINYECTGTGQSGFSIQFYDDAMGAGLPDRFFFLALALT